MGSLIGRLSVMFSVLKTPNAFNLEAPQPSVALWIKSGQ